MNKPTIVGLLGLSLLFAGCGTTVVEHDRHDYGYRGNGHSDYGDGQYSHHRDNGYDGHAYVVDDRTRVNHTNVNVNETNVNRTVVNRTTVNNQTVNKTHGPAKPAPHAQPQAHAPQKGESQDHKAKDKKKEDGQQ